VEVVKVHADYASVLLEDGVTVRALTDYLGHVDPGFTLRVYTRI
jgi:site-specific recombinase XerD